MRTKKRPWLKIQIPLSITDGNFGAPSGMVELQVRSHQGFIDILQALPADLPGGYIRGVCARGGFELDMEWKLGENQ